jgi:Helix-turn-helix domain
VSVANTHPSSSSRERRIRHTFWIDDRVIDCFAPVMSRFPFGAAALGVYIVLARRADRDGNSWPRLELIANESGSSERTVQRAIRLLEVLRLVEVALCYEQGSNRQTSNRYTLLTPPDRLPDIDPDPDKWPPPRRRTFLVRDGNRGVPVATAHVQQGAPAGADTAGSAPRQADTPPASHRHPPGVRLTPQEGNTVKDNTLKEGTLQRETTNPTFTIEEIGLTNRQVWAATLGELARRGEIGGTELESWLRPAALVGRDGETPPSGRVAAEGVARPGAVHLVIGAPNAVSRERIATRLLPAVRAALAATIGVPVEVSVVVAERR